MKKGARTTKATKGKKQTMPIEEEIPEEEPNQFELGQVEKDCCKQNFAFYDVEKRGFVERFELPMLLAQMGYNLTDARIKQLDEFLDKQDAVQIDLKAII